jgi:hypothetical protein
MIHSCLDEAFPIPLFIRTVCKVRRAYMDLDPVVWVIIILVATAVGGGLMLWSTGSRNKRR